MLNPCRQHTFAVEGLLVAHLVRFYMQIMQCHGFPDFTLNLKKGAKLCVVGFMYELNPDTTGALRILKQGYYCAES